jgi:hypothetical protein
MDTNLIIHHLSILSLNSTAHPANFKITDLPHELFSHILAFVTSNRDLCNLCLVSKSAYDEASRVLYRDGIITLQAGLEKNRTTLNALHWFSTIKARPHLAKLVRWLWIDVDQGAGQLDDKLAKPVSEGMRCLVNLKKYVPLPFCILSPRPYSLIRLSLSKSATEPWVDAKFKTILDGHPFQLETFENLLFQTKDVIAFLFAHPEIRVWHNSYGRVCPIPQAKASARFLPNVYEVAVPIWVLPVFEDRLIADLTLTVHDGWSETALPQQEEILLKSLKSFRSTLKRLKIRRDLANDQVPLLDLIACIAESVPFIVELRIEHCNYYVRFHFGCLISTQHSTRSGDTSRVFYAKTRSLKTSSSRLKISEISKL